MSIPGDRIFHGKQHFDLVTLTLKYDRLLKNQKAWLKLIKRIGKAFIFHMYIPSGKTSHVVL